MIQPQIAWVLFELPNLILVFASLYANPFTQINFILVLPYIIHYINRVVIYPIIMIKPNASKFPLEIIILASLFTISNGYFQCKFLLNSDTQCVYTSSDLVSLSRFLGLIIFFLGLFINIWHDYSLKEQTTIQSNSAKKSQYIIPQGRLFKYICSPNYFGEIVEWIGYAIFTQNLAGYLFAIATFSHLVPRALLHLEWYRQKFKEEYPKKKKAVIPFIL